MLRVPIVILGFLSLLLSNNISEKTFLFCLKSNIPPLEISRSNDNFTVDNKNLNAYFKKNYIINIEEWIPQATEQDFDGDIYLNRIYRVYLSNDSGKDVNSLISEI